MNSKCVALMSIHRRSCNKMCLWSVTTFSSSMKWLWKHRNKWMKMQLVYDLLAIRITCTSWVSTSLVGQTKKLHGPPPGPSIAHTCFGLKLLSTEKNVVMQKWCRVMQNAQKRTERLSWVCALRFTLAISASAKNHVLTLWYHFPDRQPFGAGRRDINT